MHIQSTKNYTPAKEDKCINGGPNYFLTNIRIIKYSTTEGAIENTIITFFRMKEIHKRIVYISTESNSNLYKYSKFHII